MLKVDLQSVRVLLVDDNPHMRRILRALLSGMGLRDIYDCEDGARGIEEFQRHLPDIVITDWMMPILDGGELTRMLRNVNQSPNPYVPIIVITGYAEKHVVIAARDAGVTEFVCKPVSAKQLYDRLVNAIVNPRPFVRTKHYFGPDRRRFISPVSLSTDRRRVTTRGEVSAESAALAARTLE
jgi:CheY-like chemotaxis protein